MCLLEAVLRNEEPRGYWLCDERSTQRTVAREDSMLASSGSLAAEGRTAVATVEVRLFAGDERCADRVDGRPRQTEGDDNVASIAGRWVDVHICGLRALT